MQDFFIADTPKAPMPVSHTPRRPFPPDGLALVAASRAEYAAAFSDIFEISQNGGETDDSGYDLRIRPTDKFVLTESEAPAHRATRSPRVRQNALDCFSVRLILSGRMEGRMGGRPIDCNEGDLVFVDLLQTSDMQIAPGGFAEIALWIPRVRVLASIAQEHLLHGLVLPGGSPSGAAIGGSLKLLAQQSDRLDAGELNALADGMVEYISRAAAPLLATRANCEEGSPPLSSFVTIRRHIDQHLRSPALNAVSLAKTFGLSRAALYRLFEPVGGIATYIRASRLDRAYQEIVAPETSNRRIGPIAYSLGFKNLSAFNRLFKKIYGFSPREARAAAFNTASPPPRDSKMSQASSLARHLGLMGLPPRREAPGSPQGPASFPC